MNIKEYLKMIGLNKSANNTKELRKLLDNNKLEYLWDYPLSELDHIKENDLSVVQVEDRYFEVKKELEICPYCKNNKLKFNYLIEATSDFRFEDIIIEEYDSNNPINIRCANCGREIDIK